ncbi:GspE/PulE family protein [Halanaerobium sp. MA284_MarDTE_T2]|uniref:GspE/PulE family protein n=1 Tax=Halanaerobium sp. MA284_MarDTE_T2 TaxID=2183913 RepID=UPI000DF4C478|nr:GspE/PulE family protein [Halanaerobium sp. MA284_MarDTE_T2]RCW50521.1 type IV pilus assembly protein PilB [Halanaerobium sp. MA284_MarDTE_T2]
MKNFLEFLYQSTDMKKKNYLKIKDNHYNDPADIINFIKKNKFLEEKELLILTANYFDIYLYNSEKFNLEESCSEHISLEMSEKYGVLPLNKKDDTLYLAVTIPLDLKIRENLKYLTDFWIEEVLVSEENYKKMKEKIYGNYFSIDQSELINQFGSMKNIRDPDIEQLKEMIKDTPVVKLVDRILKEAAALKASDIHLEPQENIFQIRYRIDGMLKKYYELPLEIAAAVISRIKVISGMDITVRHLPQDGRLEIPIDNMNYDLRISVIPTIYGEKAVLRLLSKDLSLLSFSKLGFNNKKIKQLKKILQIGSGIVLFAGPTGSGKTTTLFTMLRALTAEGINIMTVEDPVEYRLKNLNQIEVNKKRGMTFHIALRSLLRQDPDIIMIGEIRDQESAEIAVRAAVTGHLVFSTIHTINSAAAVKRLLDIGIPAYLISTALSAVISQRLLRTLCSACKIKDKVDDKLSEKFPHLKKKIIYRKKGCSECGGSGYTGRTAAAEILIVDKKIRKLINNNASEAAIQQAAELNGMETLLESSVDILADGKTSRQELMRVIAAKGC